MALAFLRNLKPEALKSHKKSTASQAPGQSDTGQRRLEEKSPNGDPIYRQDVTGDGQQADEEVESGICMDGSSNLSRRGSNESQEADQESPVEDFEDGRVVPGEVPTDLHSQFSENQFDDDGSDITVFDAQEFPADAEKEIHDHEIHTAYADTLVDFPERSSDTLEHTTVSLKPHSEYLEHSSEFLEHPSDSLKRLADSAVETTSVNMTTITPSLKCSLPTFFPQISEDQVSVTKPSSLKTPALPSSATVSQDSDHTANDTESYSSAMSRRDSVTEPDDSSNSYSLGFDNSEEERTASPHHQESHEAPTEAEFSTYPPAPPPPEPPPPPPPPRLFLPGDHTTSSTTDPSMSSSVFIQKPNHPVAKNEGSNDELLRQIQAAARKMSNQRQTLLTLEQSPSFAKPAPISESFTTNLKSVLEARQKRTGTPKLDCDQSPGKTIYYKSRIGIPPEDSELCRVFLRRVSKVEPENVPDYGSSDEKTTGYKEANCAGARAPPIVIRNSEISSGGDTKETKLIKSSDAKVMKSSDTKVMRSSDEITELASTEEEDVCDCSSSEYAETRESPELVAQDTLQNLTEEKMTLKNKHDNSAHRLLSTTFCKSDSELESELPVESCTSSCATPRTETEGKEFDRVVEDFDQFLKENVSTESLQDTSENYLPPQAHIRNSPLPDFKGRDGELRNGDVVSSTPAFVDILSEDSPFLSPNLPSLSEDESPIFDEMDEEAISKSSQTVQEHSKLLAQPLESYNILPTIKENPTRNEMKLKFSFRNVVATLRNTVSRGKKRKPDESRSFSFQDEGQMKFDENWSIQDTLKERTQTLEDHNRNKLRSLRDVFVNCEVRSFSEFTDPDQNSGKDFSVRNWREVMERSNLFSADVKNVFRIEDKRKSTSTEETAGSTELLNKTANSSPILDSLLDKPYPSQTEKLQYSDLTTKSSQDTMEKKASKSKIDVEDLTSDSSVESASRHTSSGLSSTLPSRRHHGMIQTFDSIYPTPPSFEQQRLYQKKTEPRKFSLPNKSSAGLLSPVERRQQRSQQAKFSF